jgi:hypothetical protein
MKQIVNTVNTIDFRDITNNSFVGIDWSHDHKAMVIRVERDKFMALSNHSYCNLLDCWDSTTMQSYISKALSQGDYVKVYAFNDMKELLTWLTPE